MTEQQISATRESRERVRRTFTEPLIRAGLKRPACLKVGEHEAELRRIVGRLAYLDDTELRALSAAVLEMSEGKGRDRWPREVRIVNAAYAVRRPPIGHSEKVVSYMASSAGRRALAEGHAGALLLWLKKYPGCPNRFAWRQIRERAEADRRRRRLIIERRDRGRDPSPDDQAFVEWFERVEEAARGLIEAGPADEAAA